MSAEVESALVEKLVVANRILAHYGIVDGFGHVSVRAPDPGRFLLSRSLAPASVTRDDIMRFDFDGNALIGELIRETVGCSRRRITLYYRQQNVMKRECVALVVIARSPIERLI